MSDALQRRLIGAGGDRQFVRPLGVFAPWRLQAYGYTLAAAYAAIFIYMYHAGMWLADANGHPLYQDFAELFAAGRQALHGMTGSIYNPTEFARVQDALFGAGHARFSVWPYPPIFFLVLAPLAVLPYLAAFTAWILTTLLGLVTVAYLIVRRRAAIALTLASPFTVWNVLAGYNGFLTAALLGAALLFLERRPVLAGMFIGCLTYKPQWGILIPVALIAAKEWRVFGSAAATTALLAGASVLAFGIAPWEAFPREVLAQAGINLSLDPGISNLGFDARAHWQYHQTIFGLVRALHGGAAASWLAQGLTTIGSAAVVWLVWRSPVRYALKAATLSAAVLVATPYAFAYDMAAIAVPVAFLARDQIDCGLLRGEQPLLLGLFGASMLCNFGPVPFEPVVVIALLGLILRRAVDVRREAGLFA